MKVTDKIEITNEDNMELMARYPDNYFDLAIVDPPYGIGVTKNKRLNNNSSNHWDNVIPNKEYFTELFRVSKNQIIWGGNYFIEYLKNTRCFINWDKLNHSNTYASCEMAWTSFDSNAKIFKYMWDGNRYGFPNKIIGVGKKTIRTHPTQKPVPLYEWILKNYAMCKTCGDEGGYYEDVAGDGGSKMYMDCPDCGGEKAKILDTHLGSGSIAIACHNYKFEITACELDKDYYDAAIKRIKTHVRQLTLF